MWARNVREYSFTSSKLAGVDHLIVSQIACGNIELTKSSGSLYGPMCSQVVCCEGLAATPIGFCTLGNRMRRSAATRKLPGQSNLREIYSQLRKSPNPRQNPQLRVIAHDCRQLG
jgi:hypothetical protein